MASVEDIYLFRHAVYRDVAYELQLPSERSQLHTAAISIAEQFFTNELHLVAAELATHAHLAQQGASAELLDQLAQTEFKYLLMQLEHEFQRAQWQTVTDIAAHARTCVGYNEAKHGKVCQMQARALENMGRRLEAESTWLEIAEHGKEVNNSEDIVAGLCGAGLCRIVLGRHDEATEVFASAKAYAGGNTALRAQVLMDMSMLSNNQGDFAEHERLLFEALQLIGDADSKLKTGIRGWAALVTTLLKLSQHDFHDGQPRRRRFGCLQPGCLSPGHGHRYGLRCGYSKANGIAVFRDEALAVHRDELRACVFD